MIFNLEGAGQLRREADVLVIGAGTVGLVLANELAAGGKKVVCLESGGRHQIDDLHPLNAVEQTGTYYAGADLGRFRCLGGSSSRWGGALIPFQPADLDAGGWPVECSELTAWLPRVEACFGLPPGPYDQPEVLPGAEFLARSAKWPAFAKRNVFTLLRDTIEGEEGPEVWLNATATTFKIERGRLVEVGAQAVDGSALSVRAGEVVIAAGAIESTRLLLLADRQNDHCISLNCRGLGEGFNDHLSAHVADVLPKDRSALNRLVGFRFERRGMRNIRFELAPASNLRASISPCFAHIAFSDTEGGFTALRYLMRAVQRRQTPAASALVDLAKDLPWLCRAMWWRLIWRRLLYPAGSQLQLHMVIEQRPRAENNISLSDRCDGYGQPLARIHWTVTTEDVAAMERALIAFEGSWNTGPMSKLADLHLRPMPEIQREMATGGGIYHPCGSTRMASRPSDGVVDVDLRVFGVTNLAVCATSVLPTGGGANPTMMLMLLAFRYVDSLQPASTAHHPRREAAPQNDFCARPEPVRS